MTNRFKGLNLLERVLEELWMGVHDTVQEAVIKTIPKENKCKKAKWLSEEALQTAMKGREVKSKGEKGRYANVNSNSKEEQGEIRKIREIRKPSSVINAKK